MRYFLKNKNGFSLVEVIVSTVIFGLVAVTFAGLFAYAQQSASISGTQVRANIIAEEGLEAVRNIRDNNFTNLVDGTYGLVQSAGVWQLSGTSDTVDIFTRQIVISTVNANTKQISVQVTWQQNAQRTGDVTLQTYLTSWRNVTVPPVSWANPLLQSSLDLNGGQDGLRVKVVGNFAYIVRSGGSDLRIVNISNPAAPVLTGSASVAGSATGIYVSGNFAYITSNSNSGELQIFNISNPASPTLTGTFNAAGNEDGQSVYVVGTNAYMIRVATSGPEFLVINVSNPALPVQTGSLELTSATSQLFVSGNFAYVASTSNTQELQVVNITNPALPTLAGSFNVTGNTDGLSVIGFSNTLLLGAANGNMYILNVTTPATPTLVGTHNAGGAVNDISFGNSNNYAFLATSNSVSEFRVVNITVPASPVLLGQLNLSGNSFGIAYDATLDRAFIANANNSQELIIVQPN